MYITVYLLYGEVEGNKNLFFKSFQISILNKPYIFFVIFTDEFFYFDLIEISIFGYINENIISYEIFEYLDQDIYDFDVHESINDFIQIDDNKVVFMYMAFMDNTHLLIN